MFWTLILLSPDRGDRTVWEGRRRFCPPAVNTSPWNVSRRLVAYRWGEKAPTRSLLLEVGVDLFYISTRHARIDLSQLCDTQAVSVQMCGLPYIIWPSQQKRCRFGEAVLWSLSRTDRVYWSVQCWRHGMIAQFDFNSALNLVSKTVLTGNLCDIKSWRIDAYFIIISSHFPVAEAVTYHYHTWMNASEMGAPVSAMTMINARFLGKKDTEKVHLTRSNDCRCDISARTIRLS
jgi:hypothetical protein